MTDATKVLEVLREAMGDVAQHWGAANLDLPLEATPGVVCASVGICAIAGAHTELGDAAHVAFLRGAGIEVPDSASIYEAVYRFNDSQTSVYPVVGAFVRAIAMLEAEQEPTPNADAMISILEACDQTGALVACQIVAEHPNLDLADIATLASAELFYAAQDVSRVAALSARATV